MKILKTLTVLGSTGSIGRQTLEVVKEAHGQFQIYALAAARNVHLMEEQVRAFRPSVAVMMEESAAIELRKRIRDLPVQIESGMPGLLKIVEAAAVDTVVTALSGRIGLEPTMAALNARKTIALANKETLVAAGDLVMSTAKRLGCPILPVDSEHSAIFQCMEEEKDTVNKLILTASGGPFRTWTKEQTKNVTAKEALNHPNWNMGPKITIDSATMMNKGLEIIEAHHLFGLEYDSIEVLIHPQSIIHSMVEYRDGSVLAQLGRPDMRLPIQYALSYPSRWANSFEKLDLRGKSLSFEEPDRNKFPVLSLAYKAGRTGGTLPAVMNAANEVAVEAFLQGKINFPGIVEITEEVCLRHDVLDSSDLETILKADAWARQLTTDLCKL